MTDAVSSWELKLAHAYHLLVQLDAEVEAYLAGGKARVESQIEGGTGDTLIIFRVSEKPPLEWSSLVGDILHNARSSLDSVMFELVSKRASSSQAQFDEMAVYFPIWDSSASLYAVSNSRPWHQNLLTAADLDELAKFQPFFYAEVPGLMQWEKEAIIRNNALIQLKALFRIDKHRTIHLTTAAVEYTYVTSEHDVDPDIKNAPIRRYTDGEELARVSVPPDKTLLEAGGVAVICRTKTPGSEPIGRELRYFLDEARIQLDVVNNLLNL